MKTAVSISEVVFAQTDRFSRRVKKSRSRVVSEALQEYLARHAPDEVTEAMNEVVDRLEPAAPAFSITARRQLLKRVEW